MYSVTFQTNRERSCSPDICKELSSTPAVDTLVDYSSHFSLTSDKVLSSSRTHGHTLTENYENKIDNDYYYGRSEISSSSLSPGTPGSTMRLRSGFKKQYSAAEDFLLNAERRRSTSQRRLDFSADSPLTKLSPKMMRIEPEKYPNGCLKYTSLFVKGSVLHKGEPDYGYLGPEHFVNVEEVWHYYYKYTADEPDYIFDMSEYYNRLTSRDVIRAPTGYTYGAWRNWPDGKVPIPHLSFFTHTDQQIVFKELDEQFRRKYPQVLSPFSKEFLIQVDKYYMDPSRNKISTRRHFFSSVPRNVKITDYITRFLKTVVSSLIYSFVTVLRIITAFFQVVGFASSRITNYSSSMVQSASASLRTYGYEFCKTVTTVVCNTSERTCSYCQSAAEKVVRDYIPRQLYASYYASRLINGFVRLLSFTWDIIKYMCWFTFMVVAVILSLPIKFLAKVLAAFGNLIAGVCSYIFGGLQSLKQSSVGYFSCWKSYFANMQFSSNLWKKSPVVHTDSNGNHTSVTNNVTRLMTLQNNLNTAYEKVSEDQFEVVKEKDNRSKWCSWCMVPAILLLLLLLAYSWDHYNFIGLTKYNKTAPDCKVCSDELNLRVEQLRNELISNIQLMSKDLNKKTEVSYEDNAHDQAFLQILDRLSRTEASQRQLNLTVNDDFNLKLQEMKNELVTLIDTYEEKRNADLESERNERSNEISTVLALQDELKLNLIQQIDLRMQSQVDAVEERQRTDAELRIQIIKEVTEAVKADLEDKSLGNILNNLKIKMRSDRKELLNEVQAEREALKSYVGDLVKNSVSEQLKGSVDQIKMYSNNEASNMADKSFVMIKEEVHKMITLAIALYDSDKTGKPDYALETAGGSVFGTRCTETHTSSAAYMSFLGIKFWDLNPSPRKVIQPNVHPGECWPFVGAAGQIVLKLSRPIYITGVTLEHIPKSVSPNGKIDSAPKDFSVTGLKDPDNHEGLALGTFTYQESGTPVQYFAVQNPTEKFQFIEVAFTSNWGHPEYTCVYRIRVHGDEYPA